MAESDSVSDGSSWIEYAVGAKLYILSDPCNFANPSSHFTTSALQHFCELTSIWKTQHAARPHIGAFADLDWTEYGYIRLQPNAITQSDWTIKIDILSD
jgi:hypothetical protein